MSVILGGKKGKRKKSRVIPSAKIPRSVRKRYYTEILKFVDLMNSLSINLNNTIKSGASKSELAKIIALGIDTTNAAIDEKSEPIINKFVSSTSSENKKRTENILKNSLSVSFANILDEPNVLDHLELAKIENVSLIKTISSNHWNKVIKAVSDNFTGIEQPEGMTLTQRIQEIGDISENRARVIARDQTSKLVGNLNRIRHQNIGMNEYKWHNSQDSRVVGNPSGLYPKSTRLHGNHWEREGKIYRYDSPPADGNPGHPIQCRCYGDPILDIDTLNATWVNT